MPQNNHGPAHMKRNEQERRAVQPRNPSLRFHAVSVSMPHPDKIARHGEDASFIHRRTLGVFDGVGGWIEKGIDSGRYSRKLAALTYDNYFDNPTMWVSDALKHAAKKNTRPGSSTACVVELLHNRLRGTNVGDSGILQIRNGQIIYESTAGSRSFNAPHQLSFKDQEDLSHREEINEHVQKGDVIIMASDGLWDNLFGHQIARTVEHHTRRWSTPSHMPGHIQPDKYTRRFDHALCCTKVLEKDKGAVTSGNRVLELALHISSQACTAAHSKTIKSPFQEKARKAGRPFGPGGKLDDITIVVARAVDSSQKYSVEVESMCPTCTI